MLGIVDWGIGGTSVFKLIKRVQPDLSVLYFSDTGVTPYGRMSRTELVARLNTVIGSLKKRGVTHLVIGCNAASTALGEIDPRGLKIIGIIESGVAAAIKCKPTRLGLVGGRRTVLSGIYRKAFAERGVKVIQRIAQPLSGLIERGETDSNLLEYECERILKPIRNCSHILMACTHYPAIEPTMGRFVSASTVFIDPAQTLVKKVGRWKLKSGGGDRFLTTGEPAAMQRAAFTAFGVKIGEAEKVKV